MEKPVLFWDFHGTLSLPALTWYDVVQEAAATEVPHRPLTTQMLDEHLYMACLPWFELPDGDSRHLTAPGAWWAWCEERFAAMLQKCGFTPREAALVTPHLREKSLQAERYRLFPDAVDTLRRLQNRGYRSYMLSNNFPELAPLTEALGLAPLFCGIITSAEVGFDKPRREIFDAARQLAGMPGACWMIGDNPRDDMQGGKAAGFVTVAVHGAQSPDADYTIDALGQLLALLP